MRLKRTYSSREVASLTGLTARQLQLWDASGLMAAAIPTHRTDAGGYTERRYTPIELFELLVLADLRRRRILRSPAAGDHRDSARAVWRAVVRRDRRRRTRAAADRRPRYLRADGPRRVLQPAEGADATAAGRRQRRVVEGVELDLRSGRPRRSRASAAGQSRRRQKAKRSRTLP